MHKGIRLALSVLLLASPAMAGDLLEVAPHRVMAEIVIGFGTEPHQLAPRHSGWGRREVGAFGPFTVDSDGRVYIADTKANAVKVFTADGGFERQIPMLKEPNVVSQMAVCDGGLYWLGDSAFGLAAYRLDIGTGDTLRVDLADQPEFRRIREGDDRRTHGLAGLQLSGDGLAIIHRYRGIRMPVVVGGGILAPAVQITATTRGSTPGRPAVGFTVGDQYTTSGEYTRGDLVLLDELGRPAKILVRNTEPGLVRGEYIFMRHYEPGHGIYRDVRTLDGELVSRTRSRWRSADRMRGRDIDLATEYELQEDGTFHQLYLVEDEGQMECRIAHWAGGGR